MIINNNKKKEISQINLLMKYFKNNPNKNIPTAEVVDWATSEFLKKTGRKYRDPDRGIRTLHQKGYLVMERAGVYRYDPTLVKERDLEDFTPAIREAIFKRDGYRCVFDGKGIKEGVTIHADHIKPKELGGKATLENGQTICGMHNNLKKIFKQTETGKKAFIRLYELAKAQNNKELTKFCTEVLEVFEKNGVNGHIVWTR